ncbi:MAG: UDP-2,3-diacylglucosamine diphosphatase LpxI [Boseongicola sp.]|nr:UDP-2,3-diacylglucosamine diphosphatase LpxI [Boseongicola sp.]NNL18918.1 UDP-2,3-diacylglucosamine diphosphatase LpxI [Boseongicola sp.]
MLALIAGQGRLPKILVDSLSKRPEIASLQGFDPEGLIPDRQFRLETLGSLIAELKAAGTTEVCFAGAIARPEVDPSALDAATLPLVPRIMAALQMGDDAALGTVLAIFEEADIAIKAATDLVPTLLPEAGVLSKRPVEVTHEKDAKRARTIAAALGELDLGQSCVVRKGQALALEALPGTDAMLGTLADAPHGSGGIFFKAKKPQQDARIDLPVIGVETVRNVAAAGLDGIVIQAGGVMVLDLDEVVQAVNDADLFFWIRDD